MTPLYKNHILAQKKTHFILKRRRNTTKRIDPNPKDPNSNGGRNLSMLVGLGVGKPRVSWTPIT
jgi:hypothetical protein